MPPSPPPSPPSREEEAKKAKDEQTRLASSSLLSHSSPILFSILDVHLTRERERWRQREGRKKISAHVKGDFSPPLRRRRRHKCPNSVVRLLLLLLHHHLRNTQVTKRRRRIEDATERVSDSEKCYSRSSEKRGEGDLTFFWGEAGLTACLKSNPRRLLFAKGGKERIWWWGGEEECAIMFQPSSLLLPRPSSPLRCCGPPSSLRALLLLLLLPTHFCRIAKASLCTSSILLLLLLRPPSRALPRPFFCCPQSLFRASASLEDVRETEGWPTLSPFEVNLKDLFFSLPFSAHARGKREAKIASSLFFFTQSEFSSESSGTQFDLRLQGEKNVNISPSPPLFHFAVCGIPGMHLWVAGSGQHV